MKCAEYKELASKRVEIWEKAFEELDDVLAKWADYDDDLYESVDVDEFELPESPVLDTDSFEETEAAIEALTGAEDVAQTLMDSLRTFIDELKRRKEMFEETDRDMHRIIDASRREDREIYDKLGRATLADEYDRDPLPYLEEDSYTLGEIETLIVDLKSWADSLEDC